MSSPLSQHASGFLPRELMESFQRPLPETIPEIEEQISLIEKAQKDCSMAIRRLMESEDIANGIVFPNQIHELHQQKNMLETHKQYRRVRINRLKLQNGFR